MRFFQAAILSFLLSVPCLAQTLMPARQVSVSTNAWTNLSPSAATAQAALDWADANWRDGVVDTSEWATIEAELPTVQGALDWLDGEAGRTRQAVDGNAAALSYNASAHNWNFTNLVLAVFLDMFGNTNDAYRMIADPAAFRSNYLAGFAPAETNVSVLSPSMTNFLSRLDELFAINFSNAVVPYVDGGDRTNLMQTYNLRDEIYAILRELNLGVVYPYTVSGSTYTNGAQTFLVATNWPEGTEIEVHCWGGGGSVGATAPNGGYSYGTLVVKSATNFVSTNASHVTNGMELAVQVGSAHSRAAVWRSGSGAFDSVSNELIVAGGGGRRQTSDDAGHGGGLSGVRGGTYGVADIGGYGGTQTNGGAFGGGTFNAYDSAGNAIAPNVHNGGAGRRVWGAPDGYRYEAAPGEGQPAGYYLANARGGDGYWGGGAGGFSSWSVVGMGGGGSGYVHPDLNGATDDGRGGVKGTGDSALYGSSGAGLPGNPGRVAFKVFASE